MKRTLLFASMAAFGLSAATSQATLIDGYEMYVTGEAQVGGWSPGTGTPAAGGTAADLRLWDDGATNGDATAGDGVFTCVLSGLTAGEVFKWKVASGPAPNQWVREVPSGGNGDLVTHVPASGTITFILDTIPRNDGALPDAGGSATGVGYAYTDLTEYFASASVTSMRLVGNFQSENGGTDWTPTDAVGGIDMVASVTPGIYEATVTGLPGGSYEYKMLANENWDLGMGAAGFGAGGPNLSFSVIDVTDTLTFTFAASNTTVLVANDNPLANPGPPFFAQSAAWSTGFTAAEELTANGNLFERTFVVATPGQHAVRVRQGLGRSFPDSGDYPFVTTEANQSVRVILDRNAYADTEFQPAGDFVVVLDDATGFGLNQWSRVQPVGDFQTDFGAAGNWDNNLAFMNASQTTTVGLWSVTLGAFLSNTDRALKAVANLDVDAGADNWKYQMGGPLDGVTVSGNNTAATFSYVGSDPTPIPYTFWIDTITGRVGVGNTAPVRGNYIGIQPTAADNWVIYE